jgi:hypothetical protein
MSEMIEPTLPHNLDAERAVLGATRLDADAALPAVDWGRV